MSGDERKLIFAGAPSNTWLYVFWHGHRVDKHAPRPHAPVHRALGKKGRMTLEVFRSRDKHVNPVPIVFMHRPTGEVFTARTFRGVPRQIVRELQLMEQESAAEPAAIMHVDV